LRVCSRSARASLFRETAQRLIDEGLAFIGQSQHLTLEIVHDLGVCLHDARGGFACRLFNRIDLAAGNLFGLFDSAASTAPALLPSFSRRASMPARVSFQLLVDLGDAVGGIGRQFIDGFIQLFALFAQEIGTAVAGGGFLGSLQFFLFGFVFLRFLAGLRQKAVSLPRAFWQHGASWRSIIGLISVNGRMGL
jgi:hypothetical protein